MPETFEFRITTLEKKVNSLDEQNSKTHKDFFDKFEALKIESALNKDHYTRLQTSVDAIALDVRALREKPAKNADTIWKAILGAIGSAIGGAIIFALSQGLI